MIRSQSIYILLFASTFYCGQVMSETADEFSVKAAFMVKMALFIDWPKQSNVLDTSKKFVICIKKSEKYYQKLTLWSQTGQIKKKPVIIRRIDDHLSNLTPCNILYLTNPENLNHYLTHAQNNNTLTISDLPGNAQLGVLVNFIKVNNKFRFEINYGEAKKQGFSINPRLLKVAKIVQSKGEG